MRLNRWGVFEVGKRQFQVVVSPAQNPAVRLRVVQTQFRDASDRLGIRVGADDPIINSERSGKTCRRATIASAGFTIQNDALIPSTLV